MLTGEEEMMMMLRNGCFYPSCMSVNWSNAFHRLVLVEVLWYRQSHDDWECKNKFCSKLFRLQNCGKSRPPPPAHDSYIKWTNEFQWDKIIWMHNTYQHRQTDGNTKQRRLVQGLKQTQLLFCWGVIVVSIQKNSTLTWWKNTGKWSDYLPRIEKKNIKLVDICITLRLPTCVNPSKSAFSLLREREREFASKDGIDPNNKLNSCYGKSIYREAVGVQIIKMNGWCRGESKVGRTCT